MAITFPKFFRTFAESLKAKNERRSDIPNEVFQNGIDIKQTWYRQWLNESYNYLYGAINDIYRGIDQYGKPVHAVRTWSNFEDFFFNTREGDVGYVYKDIGHYQLAGRYDDNDSTVSFRCVTASHDGMRVVYIKNTDSIETGIFVYTCDCALIHKKRTRIKLSTYDNTLTNDSHVTKAETTRIFVHKGNYHILFMSYDASGMYNGFTWHFILDTSFNIIGNYKHVTNDTTHFKNIINNGIFQDIFCVFTHESEATYPNAILSYIKISNILDSTYVIESQDYNDSSFQSTYNIADIARLNLIPRNNYRLTFDVLATEQYLKSFDFDIFINQAGDFVVGDQSSYVDVHTQSISLFYDINAASGWAIKRTLRGAYLGNGFRCDDMIYASNYLIRNEITTHLSRVETFFNVFTLDGFDFTMNTPISLTNKGRWQDYDENFKYSDELYRYKVPGYASARGQFEMANGGDIYLKHSDGTVSEAETGDVLLYKSGRTLSPCFGFKDNMMSEPCNIVLAFCHDFKNLYYICTLGDFVQKGFNTLFNTGNPFGILVHRIDRQSNVVTTHKFTDETYDLTCFYDTTYDNGYRRSFCNAFSDGFNLFVIGKPSDSSWDRKVHIFNTHTLHVFVSNDKKQQQGTTHVDRMIQIRG